MNTCETVPKTLIFSGCLPTAPPSAPFDGVPAGQRPSPRRTPWCAPAPFALGTPNALAAHPVHQSRHCQAPLADGIDHAEMDGEQVFQRTVSELGFFWGPVQVCGYFDVCGELERCPACGHRRRGNEDMVSPSARALATKTFGVLREPINTLFRMKIWDDDN